MQTLLFTWLCLNGLWYGHYTLEIHRLMLPVDKLHFTHIESYLLDIIVNILKSE